MNPSIVLTTAPSSPHPNTPFLTTFLSTTTHLRLSTIHLRRHSYKISDIRCSSDQSSTSVVKPDVVGDKRKLNAVQSVVDALSPPVRIASSVLIFAAAVAAGYGLGSRLGGSRNAAIGGAVAVGAAGAGAAYALNSCVPEVAAASLHNYVVESGGPAAIKKEDVDAIAKKYGVSKQNEAFNAELCDIYCQFVSAVLPPGDEDLKGDEVETIIKFKNSLGIDDPDAAAMHMEIGRRIFRQRLETGDRDADMEQRRAFQKLVYVSNLVFGEASGFLLPWKRVFKVTDSQVEVAVRDNAQRLYAFKLAPISQDVDASQLISLREAQLLYRLSDQLAEDMFREHTRKLVEQSISAALSVLKSRNKTVKPVIEELDKILAFNNKLLSLKSHPDASRFARGVGAVSLIGGEYDGDRKMDDLKLLYRAYVTDALSGGRMEEEKLAALNQLRNIFGLGRREAESVALEVTSKVYRRSLQEAVSSGELIEADSKAAYLQNLCEKLHFDAEKAIEIHEEIYRRKLQLLVADKGELSDEDVKTLDQIRIMFCIPKQTVEAAHADICGGVFEKVVKEAIASGIDGYDAEIKKAVRKAAFGLRLTREVAISIASKAVRRIFINYIQRARAAGSRTESAKELKKMIAFNSLVVTELVADIKGESADSPPPEEPATKEEPQTEDDEEWVSLQSLRKARPSKDSTGKPSQKEINLRDDLPERDRTDLYKTYLMFCLTGEVTRIPFGAQITTKKDDSEFVLLNQLGGILGLTDTEIVEVHRSLAEQAFRQEAEVILADGQLTKSRIEQLNALQKNVGLPSQYAEKIIKSITTSKLSAALETAAGRGRLSLKEIRELKENGVDVDNMITGSLRENLFKKTIDDIFSSGTGEFDAEEVYEKIPKDLNINAEKAKQVVHELAQTRLSNSLLQAVALLRQRNYQGVVNSLNDLLACDKAVPSTPLSWEVPEELADLFLVYLKSDQAAEKVARVQYLLNISDSAAEALRAVKDKGLPNGAPEQEEFVF
ncbi:translocon at the inner envelope membrane of chloroplasts 110 [Perilla frutescens var. hirtella]|uniref:Translocon at the inner envelope membrane of chloroplasts 110 n=1 Tax=Perilla frutescens var. hirtella TaxID=608512 RepID=A0AAD4JNI0_PERFH|nr:translocon at the inner envelope membrane of chloroplasts 110 [Perilla frutescens var. hirtella]